MLQDLLDAAEKSSFILITDEVKSCGRALLLNFVLESLKRHPSVIVACVERPIVFFKNWLPPDLQHKVTWVESKLDEADNDIFDWLTKAVESVNGQTAIIIDSLSTTIFLKDSPWVCQALHKLKKAQQVSQLIALLHRDVHEDSTCELLNHQASSVLNLKPGSQGCQQCHIRHLRSTGKVLKSIEVFQFDKSFLIQNIRPLDKVEDRLAQNQQPKDEDPTSQLTFNLSLTSSEEEARSQMILPYVKESRTKEEPVSQGRIHYQADDADDFDEEDPDDDLNI